MQGEDGGQRGEIRTGHEIKLGGREMERNRQDEDDARRIGFPVSDQLAGEFGLNPAELAGEFWERGGVNSRRMSVGTVRAMRRRRAGFGLNSAGISGNNWLNLTGRVAV